MSADAFREVKAKWLRVLLNKEI